MLLLGQWVGSKGSQKARSTGCRPVPGSGQEVLAGCGVTWGSPGWVRQWPCGHAGAQCSQKTVRENPWRNSERNWQWEATHIRTYRIQVRAPLACVQWRKDSSVWRETPSLDLVCPFAHGGKTGQLGGDWAQGSAQVRRPGISPFAFLDKHAVPLVHNIIPGPCRVHRNMHTRSLEIWKGGRVGSWACSGRSRWGVTQFSDTSHLRSLALCLWVRLQTCLYFHFLFCKARMTPSQSELSREVS